MYHVEAAHGEGDRFCMPCHILAAFVSTFVRGDRQHTITSPIYNRWRIVTGGKGFLGAYCIGVHFVLGAFVLGDFLTRGAYGEVFFLILQQKDFCSFPHILNINKTEYLTGPSLN